MITVPFCAFPDENIDPKKKREKDWIIKAARAVLYSYSQLPVGGIGLNSAPQYQKNRLYSVGRQPIVAYKRQLQGNPDGNNPQLVIDWSIRNIISTPRRNCISLVSKVPFKIQINPIDPLSREEVRDELTRMESKLIFREALKGRGMNEMLDLPQIRLEHGEASDFDDLATKEYEIKNATAMDNEMLVDNVLISNNYPDINEHCLEDYFDTGLMVIRDDSEDNKTIRVSRVPPELFIINYCTQKDFSDWKFMGYVEPIQACEVIAQSGGQVSEEDIKRIYEIGLGSLTNYNLGYPVPADFPNWTYGQFYSKGQLLVLDFEYRSSDVMVLEERELDNGTKLFKRINPEKEGKTKKNKYHKKYKENIYCGKWIVGTDIVYDYGEKSNKKVDRRNPSVVLPSFHVQACDLVNMIARSRMESCIPIIDSYQIARYKLENTLSTAIPSGWRVNLDALESVSLSAGGDKMSPEQLLNLFVSRGVLIYRGKDIEGDGSNPPIEFLQGGIGSEIAEYWNIMAAAKIDIKADLGLNDFTDASTPNPKSLTTIAQAAMAGTNNALGDMFSAQTRMRRSLAKSIMIRCQDIVHYGNSEYLAYSLGSSSVRSLENIKNIDKYIYSVEIADMPTPEEVSTIEEQIQIAQKNGEITIADVLTLKNLTNYKQKEAFLVARVAKNQLRKQQEQLQMVKANGETQVQSTLLSEEAKQKTAQLKNQLDMEYMNAEYDRKMQLEQLKLEYGLEDSRIDATGRIESAVVQAKGRDENNIRDNKTKLIDNDKSDKTDEISIPANLHSTVEPQTAFDQPLKFNMLPDLANTENTL